MAPQLQLAGQPKDLGGGFLVRRLLPAPQRQAVGPFIFMDHFGPVAVQPDAVHDIRAHPHIGLATVTYLFEGAMMHRDSLGIEQRIEPGAINWMTAGRGIVHSERAPHDMLDKTYVNHGLQLWAALPREHETTDPAFQHTAAADVPELTVNGTRVRVLIGAAFGQQSPVATFVPTLYLHAQLRAGQVFDLPPLAQELAVYAIDADITVNGEPVAQHTLALLAPEMDTRVACACDSRLMVIGGDPLDGPRFMWWNFVSSRKERIAQAAQDWSAHAFGYVVGESEIVPLPERRAVADRRRKPRTAAPTAPDRRD